MTKMTATLNLYKKSILAGIFIGIGGFTYLSVDNKILGAILFSFGLISVVILNQKLYTGIIGYVGLRRGHYYLFTTLIGNIFGAGLISLLISPLINEQAVKIVENKLNNPLPETFIKSIICGMLIYLAVELYKHKQDLLCLILPVVIFILTEAEHCIADVFYCFASCIFDIRMLYFIPICIIGNSIGSIIIRWIQEEIKQ